MIAKGSARSVNGEKREPKGLARDFTWID